MDVKAKNELLKLIESAISECVRVGQDALSNGQQWMEEDAKTSQSQFEKIRYQLLNDTLPRSDGAGLGITRALRRVLHTDVELKNKGKNKGDSHQT